VSIVVLLAVVVVRLELVGCSVVIVGEKLLVRLVVVSDVWPIIWTISDIWWIWLVIIVRVLLVVIVVVMFGKEL
jgi:hypothetical protein